MYIISSIRFFVYTVSTSMLLYILYSNSMSLLDLTQTQQTTWRYAEELMLAKLHLDSISESAKLHEPTVVCPGG